MKVLLVAVGRPRGSLAEVIGDYEGRLKHYYSFQAIAVREERLRASGDVGRVRQEEGRRLLGAVPPGAEVVALHETGTEWTSVQLSEHLQQRALDGSPAVAFVVGGAYGLSDELLAGADRRLSLSAFTLPHEIARLVMTEQLYRAGTIGRGEPYHKGRDT